MKDIDKILRHQCTDRQATVPQAATLSRPYRSKASLFPM